MRREPTTPPSGGQNVVQPDTVFYDGHCGLCHRAVRFVIARDPEGKSFVFAPLDGETFRRTIGEDPSVNLPDSIVVAGSDGAIRVRSDAVRHILERLGGRWKISAWLLQIVPSRVADAVYDLVAGLRSRLFATPAESCPVVPGELRRRFLP